MEALGGEDCFVIAQLLFNQAVNHAHTKHFHRGLIIGQNSVSGGIPGPEKSEAGPGGPGLKKVPAGPGKAGEWPDGFREKRPDHYLPDRSDRPGKDRSRIFQKKSGIPF